MNGSMVNVHRPSQPPANIWEGPLSRQYCYQRVSELLDSIPCHGLITEGLFPDSLKLVRYNWPGSTKGVPKKWHSDYLRLAMQSIFTGSYSGRSVVNRVAYPASGSDDLSGNGPSLIRSQEGGQEADFRGVDHAADGVAPGRAGSEILHLRLLSGNT